jgi:signal transduction histidine kinase
VDKHNSIRNPSVTDPQLHFKISTGLKRIIGRDLITNDFVAIFELVKNSYDARATRVDIIFEPDRIIIADNGKGMSYSDLENKWLFVAYSAKKDGTEDGSQDNDYREKIDSKRAYAGSKGVGRFSCDRLGSQLVLQTRAASPQNATVEVLRVDWERFEHNATEEFMTVGVEHRTSTSFSTHKELSHLEAGTVLEITSLRDVWPRRKILDLKQALAKLINPFSGAAADFEIFVRCDSEHAGDELIVGTSASDNIDAGEADSETTLRQVVNGRVDNFIFETLSTKTTHLRVEIDASGQRIFSTLIDRGETIYTIAEPNPYETLQRADFKCNLYYLNQSAKATFTRRMGVSPAKFGSVFLFRNGFRVFPLGEEGDDSFKIDRRKQQGYARYLGTRDILGRIDVQGSEESFRESTSRDQGLIETPAYLQLRDCFWERCLRRLENYVVGVTWVDSLDSTQEDISRLTGDKARSRIIEIVSKLANGSDVELLAYSHNLIDILNEKSEDFERSLDGLRLLADKAGDPELAAKIAKAEIRYRELKHAEQLALAQADKERKARIEAEARVRLAEKAQLEAEKTRDKIENAYNEERKRNLFLASVTTLDYDNIVNLHHQIGIYSADIHHLISNQLDKLQHNERIDDDDLLNLLEQLSFKNQKILSVSRFATKANFRLESEMISEDIVSFFDQYVSEVCTYYSGDGLHVEVNVRNSKLIRSFKPIEISMIIDNLVNNAEKAGATRVSFDIEQVSTKMISISVTDDGQGIDRLITDPSRIFEKGFSTTDGSGLGLYHVAYMLDQMGGSIELMPNNDNGTQFVIRIKE